jgi:hypothetical protein
MVSSLAEKLSQFWPFVLHAVQESDEVIKHTQCLENFRAQIEPAAASMKSLLNDPTLLTQGLSEAQVADYKRHVSDAQLPNDADFAAMLAVDHHDRPWGAGSGATRRRGKGSGKAKRSPAALCNAQLDPSC